MSRRPRLLYKNLRVAPKADFALGVPVYFSRKKGGYGVRAYFQPPDKLIREAAALAASAERRRGEARFLCEGARLCEDAARSGVQIDQLFFYRTGAAAVWRIFESVLPGSPGTVFGGRTCSRSSLLHPEIRRGSFCVCETPENLKQGKTGFFMRLCGGLKIFRIREIWERCCVQPKPWE